MNTIKTFHQILANTLVVTTTNNFLWFALAFWAYIETQSVLASSIIGGAYMLVASVCGLFFGTFVDHHKKKIAMLYSSLASLVAFGLAGLLYIIVPHQELLNLKGIEFWVMVLFILFGAIAGNMRGIALSTTVTMLIPEGKRDKANGLVGMINGIGFTITSVFSGLAIGFLSMGWALGITIALTTFAILHLLTVQFKEKAIEQSQEEHHKKLDLRGTIQAIQAVPGLLALLFFATFNNFLGGVFMSLMDPYGLSLVSVEAWGIVWGIISLGFILGGIVVAKRGLGTTPLRTMFFANIVMWLICIAFPVRSSIILLTVGMVLYMCLIPVVEAAEQTIIQGVVPFKRQGRVFGFAQSLEMAASPITAFLIGPIAQFWVIPYMTNGGGTELIGSWFGTGPARAMALIFIVAGTIGLIVTILAMFSRAYRVLSQYKPRDLSATLELPEAPITKG